MNIILKKHNDAEAENISKAVEEFEEKIKTLNCFQVFFAAF